MLGPLKYLPNKWLVSLIALYFCLYTLKALENWVLRLRFRRRILLPPVYTKENGLPLKLYNISCRLPERKTKRNQTRDHRIRHSCGLGRAAKAKQLWKTCRGLLGSFSAFCLLVACLFCHVQCRATCPLQIQYAAIALVAVHTGFQLIKGLWRWPVWVCINASTFVKLIAFAFLFLLYRILCCI